MSKRHPVVWSEGLLLSPQHLQQWDRHVHHFVSERFRAAHSFDWGFTQLEIDRESLRNGRFAILQARGILPDGTPFAIPEEQPVPPARSLEGHFGTRQEVLQIHFGLPSARPGRPQVGVSGSPAVPGAPQPRYVAEPIELPDDSTGTNERSVTVARPNFCLLFPDEALADHDVLPIVEVVRTGEGGYALRESFVPPCLSIGASETLLRQLRSEIEMLITKSGELGDRRRQRGKDVADFSSGESANFWLLHTVNSYIPAFAHFVGTRRAHPEQVYLTMAALAGSLCTFSPDLAPKDLPGYDHRAPASSFAGLHAVLVRLLETVISSRAVRIDLERRGDSMYVGRIQDPRLLEPAASLFLGVTAEVEEQRLVVELPAKIKIASLDQIDFLIANALRGVAVNFSRVPPAALPVKSTFLYFELDSRSEAWAGIKGAKNLAIFAPPEFPGLSLELLGLRE